MVQFFYASRSTHPRGHLSDLDILREATQNNSTRNISGCLLRSATHFFQILEGDAAELEQLVEIICRDTRHYDLVAAPMRSFSPRIFDGWAMAYGDCPQWVADSLQQRLKHDALDWTEILELFGKTANLGLDIGALTASQSEHGRTPNARP